jgi:hypothetical protein
LPENRVAVNAIFKTRKKALFGFSVVCRQQKGKTMQSHDLFSENLLKILAAGVFSGPFSGFLFVSTAEHLKTPSCWKTYVKKDANGFNPGPVNLSDVLDMPDIVQGAINFLRAAQKSGASPGSLL